MHIIEQTRAPNPRRVRIFLAEKGIPMTFEQVDLGQKQHKNDEFRRLNPIQQVPVLILDDGTAISETMAICRYFEEVQPEPALLGRGPKERALIEMWNRRMELQLFFRVTQAFRHRHPAMAELESPQVPAWGEVNVRHTLELLAWLDGELATQKFVAGDNYSVADITALVAIDWMKPARIERPASLTHLERWHKAVSARPSAKA